MQKYFIWMAMLFMGGCSVPSKFYVTNVQDITQFEESSFVYGLPRTVLQVKVTVIKTKTIPGPYHMYAKEYLGIDGVPHQPSVKWEIDNVDITSRVEIDPGYFYSVRSNELPIHENSFFRLKNEGLILDAGSYEKTVDYEGDMAGDKDRIYFTDLSLKKPLKIDTDTLFRELFRDSTFVRVPHLKKELVAKTHEEKAREAVQTLIKIRKRRFHMFAARYDFMPEGEAARVSVEVLNALEENYLSLFIGKTITEEYEKTYLYTPEASKDMSRLILFRFDDNAGLLGANDIKGKPAVLEISDKGHTQNLENLNYPYSGSPVQNTLFYRIPDKGYLKLILGSRVLAEAALPVYQYGVVVPMTVQGK